MVTWNQSEKKIYSAQKHIYVEKTKKKSKCKMFNNNNIHHIKIKFVKLKLQNKNIFVSCPTSSIRIVRL